MPPKAHKVTRRDIDELFSSGLVFKGTYFFVRARASETFKVGIIVSKKIAPSVVERNTIRRMLYHSVYPFVKEKQPRMKMVYIVTKKPTQENKKEYVADMISLLDKVVSTRYTNTHD